MFEQVKPKIEDYWFSNYWYGIKKAPVKGLVYSSEGLIKLFTAFEFFL